MKKIGDDYVRQEFKAHVKEKVTQQQLNQFTKSWSDYLIMLRQRDGSKIGISLNKDTHQLLNEEQKGKLKKFKSGLDSISQDLT